MIIIAIIINIARNETEQTIEQKQANESSNEDEKKKKRGEYGRENSKGERRRIEMEVVEVGRWKWK
jgi:hypothetical protein